jgi:hypothetical protein
MDYPPVPAPVARVAEAYSRVGADCYAWVAPDGAILMRFPDAAAAARMFGRVVDQFDDELLDELAALRARRDQEHAAAHVSPLDPRVDG